MSRRVIDEMRRMSEHHRYLRGLRAWVGFRQIGIPIERSARQAGRTKYNPIKLLMLAFDGIFAFSIVPLRAAMILGVFAIFLSGLFTLYSLYVKFWLHSPEGFTATIVVMTFLSGVNLFFLGVIGEYLGRVYEETKARPHYVVGKVVGRLSGVRSIRDAEAWEHPTSLTGTD
jgi:dolichol-phosphate mannosyltransferase